MSNLVKPFTEGGKTAAGSYGSKGTFELMRVFCL